MDEMRYFEKRALDFAAAARETKDCWYAERFIELASRFAEMARRAPYRPDAAPRP